MKTIKGLNMKLALVVLSLVSVSGFAAEKEHGTLAGHREALEAPRMYFAPKAGLVVPIDLGNRDAAFAYGGELGFPVADHSTLALSIMRDYSGVLPIMGKLIQHAQAGSGLNYGLQAGIIHNSVADNNEFGAGLVLGYDYRVTPAISVGLSAEHVTAFADDMFHLVHFMVPVKFHF